MGNPRNCGGKGPLLSALACTVLLMGIGYMGWWGNQCSKSLAKPVTSYVSALFKYFDKNMIQARGFVPNRSNRTTVTFLKFEPPKGEDIREMFKEIRDSSHSRPCDSSEDDDLKRVQAQVQCHVAELQSSCIE